ncbi:MAG: ABC transporter permease [Planctomycetaceae bacterium]
MNHPRWTTIGPPVILLLAVLAAWQFAVRWYDWPVFLVPAPTDVVRAVVESGDRLLAATARTALAAVAGLLASLGLGVGVALVFSQSRLVRASCYPYAVFLQTVPIIAVAPLIINWCGTGFSSVVLVTLIISVFPIIASTTSGLLGVEQDLLDLFRLYRAGRWQMLWNLRLPHAVPSLVTGARTSSGMAVIGAIVGEFFVGHTTQHYGLGYLVLSTSQNLKTDHLFAAVIASALLGIALFGAVTLIGATVLARWYHLPESNARPG